MDENIRKLQDWIDESQNIVFFGGAGVSTESGIPDFRSTDGLYHQQYDYPPETILSHTFFEKNPAEFYRFYRDKMIVQGAKPNAAHLKLAELERAGKLKAVVTQNIDGLHQAAGSKVVYELHGSTLRNYCTRCRKKYPLSFIAESTGVPHCTEPNCGGIVRPDVVLYEEGRDLAGGLPGSRPHQLLRREEAGAHQQIPHRHGLPGGPGHQRPDRRGLLPDHREMIKRMERRCPGLGH